MYEVSNIFGFLTSSPLVTVTNQVILFLFVCFLGNPSNASLPIWLYDVFITRGLPYMTSTVGGGPQKADERNKIS